MTSNEFILSSITKPDYFFKIVKHNGEAFVSTALLKQAIKDTPQPFIADSFLDEEPIDGFHAKLKMNCINHVYAEWLEFYIGVGSSSINKDKNSIKLPDRAFWRGRSFRDILPVERLEENILIENYETLDVKDYTVLDVETTGLSKETDDIIQLSAVKYRDDKVVDKLDLYIKPLDFTGLSSFIKDLTGITDYEVMAGHNAGDVIDKINEFIGDDILVGHNLGFDIGMLEAMYAKNGFDWDKVSYIDTLKMARVKLPGMKARGSYKLENLKKMLSGVDDLQSHNALNDCIINGKLYIFLKDK